MRSPDEADVDLEQPPGETRPVLGAAGLDEATERGAGHLQRRIAYGGKELCTTRAIRRQRLDRPEARRRIGPRTLAEGAQAVDYLHGILLEPDVSTRRPVRSGAHDASPRTAGRPAADDGSGAVEASFIAYGHSTRSRLPDGRCAPRPRRRVDCANADEAPAGGASLRTAVPTADGFYPRRTTRRGRPSGRCRN